MGDQQSGTAAWDDSLKNTALWEGLLRFWSQALFAINCKVKSSGEDECEGFRTRALCQ